MNKLFSKIAALTLGLGLAVGVGVAAGRGVREAKASSLFAPTELADGIEVFITTTYDEKTYYLPTAKASSKGPSAVEFSNIDSVDEANLWTVTKSGDNWVFTSGEKHLYCIADNNGIRVDTSGFSGQQDKWTYSSGSLRNASTNRYVGVYNKSDWRSYTSHHENYHESDVNLVFYKEAGPALESITYDGTLTKTEYYVGQAFDPTGLTFTAHYEGGTTGTLDASLISWATLKEGDTSVVGTYKTKQVTVTGITVAVDQVSSVTITGELGKTLYKVGEEWDASNIVVTAVYPHLDDKDVTSEVELVFDPASPALGVTSVTVSANYSGKTGSESFTVEVVEKIEAQLVTSEDTLSIADVVFFVSSGKVSGALGNNSYMSAIAVTISDSKFEVAETHFGLELHMTASGKWNLVNDGKKLGVTGNSSNKLALDGSGADNGWEFSIDNSNKVTASNGKATGMKIMYNVGSPRFSNYTSNPGDNMLLPNLYRIKATDQKVVEVFENEYLHMSDYTTSEGYCKDSEHNYYGFAKAAYGTLTTAQKALLSEADLLRLAAWAEANGEKFENGEFITTSSPVGQFTSAQPGPVILIIMGTVAALSFGVVTLLKTRKKEK